MERERNTISLKKENGEGGGGREREKERDITNESLFRFAEAKSAERKLA